MTPADVRTNPDLRSHSKFCGIEYYFLKRLCAIAEKGVPLTDTLMKKELKTFLEDKCNYPEFKASST